MSDVWIGSIVSVNCGEVLGVFEGEISRIDATNQTISLINVSRNSAKCQVPEITLGTNDIKNLKLLQSTVEKRSSANALEDQNGPQNCSPVPCNSLPKKGSTKIKTPRKPDKQKHQKDLDDAFSAPVDSELLDNDFDFEKNLALFDKQAVFNEINSQLKSNHVKLVDCNKRTKINYRPDENVLNGDIVILRQISVPCKSEKEYVTDTGLIVPSVTVDFKQKLYCKAEEVGMTQNARTESIGRAACEMVLHLVGGSHRLNPQNTHQRPSIVIMCGPHIQGIQGINCARHLANHMAKVFVWYPQNVTNPFFINELKLYKLTGGTSTTSLSVLPATVDFVIDALESHIDVQSNEQIWFHPARHWAKQCKANVLSLDPPPNTDANMILSPALPFTFTNKNCSIHICDIGIPSGLFKSLGAKYSSPFGSKFIIPLYWRSED